MKDSKEKEKEINREEIEEVKNNLVKAGKEIKDLKNETQRINSGKDWREIFVCPKGEEGCIHCKDYEKILSGEAQYVSKDIYGKDGYILIK